MTKGYGQGVVVPVDELPHSEHAHRFVGAEHGQVPVSIILVHAAPGIGPSVHRHPYAEIFVVESGRATFRLGDDELIVEGGNIVVGPPGVPHGFTNSGESELRVVAIHASERFVTEQVAGRDHESASPGR